MALFDDLVSPSGGFYFYDLVNAPGTTFAAGAGVTDTATAANASVATGTAASASGAGVTDAASAPNGSALGYQVVTVTLPVYNGIGSIFYGYGESWGNFVGTPQAGDTIRFQSGNGFRILPDGTIEASARGTFTYFYNDGTGEVQRTVVIDDSVQVFAAAGAATASPPTSTQYGGVTIEGDAPDVTATPASGTPSTGNIATGAGSSATTSAPSSSARGDAAAGGASPGANAVPADGVAENSVTAPGAGAQAEAVVPIGVAAGDVEAIGEGVTVNVTPVVARATGDRLPGAIPYSALTVVYPKNLLIARAAA